MKNHKMIPGIVLLTLLLSACTAPGPERPSAASAGEAVWTSLSGDEMKAVLLNTGYRAELDVDSVGDPMILSSTGGLNYTIFFYGCSEEKRCDSLQFWAGFSLEGKPSLQDLNEWNRAVRMSRAYLDAEDHAVVEMDLLVEGGITESTLVEALKIWDWTLPRFAEHLEIR